MTEKHEGVALLTEEPESPLLEIDELRSLMTVGRERGYLTFEEIASCLEEVEITKTPIGPNEVRELIRTATDREV